MPRGIKAPLTRWYFRWPGEFHACGPTIERHYEERDARRDVRKVCHLKILPKGMEFWRAS